MPDRKDLNAHEKTLLALAAIGAGFMGYLLHVHFSGGSSVCNFSASFNCQIVNQSIYAEVLGLPVSAIGLLFFVAVFGAVLVRPPRVFTWIQLATAASLVFGLYLSFVEARVLYTYCLFCEGSKLMMLGIIWAAHVAGKRAGEKSAAWEWAAAIAAGAVGTAVAWKLQTS